MLYIKSLSLENVKCFGKRQTIDFTQGKDKIAQWTVILGDNGAGKTTVLRSLVAMLPLPRNYAMQAHHLELSFVKWIGYVNFDRPSQSENFEIGLQICDSKIRFTCSGNTTELRATGEPFAHDPESFRASNFEYDSYPSSEFHRPICIGYGASRRMARKSISDKIAEDVSRTLFDDEALIQNSEEYLLKLALSDTSSDQVESQQIKNVKELLLRVLPSGVKDIRVKEIDRLEWQVQVETPYGWVPMNELSLGYKTTIAWLIDFATKMIYFHEKSENPFAEPAILIIDEIDLHMHPAWQREIIQQLTDLFPKTQFIVTAHSPLIAQAALDANIVVLKREGDEVVVYNDPAIVRSWRIDQVLTSDLFGLTEARPHHIEVKMKRRRTLLKKADKLTVKERKELDQLNVEIDAMPIGEGPVQMDAIDVLQDFADKLAAFKAGKAV